VSEQNPNPTLQILLDRLVDGELSLQERAEVLRQLEHTPDGWRRCALSFLEGQSWRGELSALLTERRTPSPAPAPAVLPDAEPAKPVDLETLSLIAAAREPARTPQITLPPRTAERPVRDHWFTLAASLLAAFTVGIIARGIYTSPQSAPTPAPASLAAQSPVRTAPARPANPTDGRGQLATLAWDNGGSDPQAVTLPVLDRDQLDAVWADPDQAEVSPELLRELGRQGHRLIQRRELRPTRLEDGRPAMVPVDRLQLDYVGDQYQ
jgi:hypothetical protein